MHAQKEQLTIDTDDVIKMKIIVDAVIYKIFKPIWEKEIKDLREGPIKN